MKSRACVPAALLGCALLMLTSGCATSPEAGESSATLAELTKPKPPTGMEAELSNDEVRYRRLQRDDFRASLPPPRFGDPAVQSGALTCVAIKLGSDVAIDGLSRASEVDYSLDRVEFVAWMDRGCSWWNPRPGSYPEAYVLEHEQIHFALFEVAARKLTRRVARQTLTVASDIDPEEVVDLFRREIDRELRAAVTSVMERSLRFDEDTQVRHSPELQRGWLETLERELAENPR